MADLEQQLQAMLSNPELMNQLFSMAGSLGTSRNPPPSQPQSAPASAPFDAGTVRNLMVLMKRTQLEPRQAELLRALENYLPADRIEKLRRAMLASKIARYAAGAFSESNQGR